MPCCAGAKNYKNDVLIPIIAEILPNEEYGWEAIALAYQDQTRESTKQDTNDLKWHWIHNLCQSMKKPMGKLGENTDRVLRCIAIEQKIMDKTYSGMLGIEENDNEEKEEEDEQDNVVGGEREETHERHKSPPMSIKDAHKSINS